MMNRKVVINKNKGKWTATPMQYDSKLDFNLEEEEEDVQEVIQADSIIELLGKLSPLIDLINNNK